MSLPLAARGEFALVQTQLEAALDKPGQPVRRGTMAHDHHMYMLLTEAAAQQRDAAGLKAYAPRLAGLAERDGHKLYQGIAARAFGVVRRLAGDNEGAAEWLSQARETFSALGTRWQLGRTLAELAEAALARGDTQAARDLYTQAAEEYEAMRAMPDRNRTQDLIAGLAEAGDAG